MKRGTATASLVALAALLPGAAQAHVGAGDAHGFIRGFMHPVGGADHVLAMVAVGLFAAGLGGRALWLVPAAFLSMMIAGGMAGAAGLSLPFVEIGIAASVAVLGLAVACRWNVPVAAAMALAGFFAVFHGHAHGAEMPSDASGLAYGAGFVLATAALHLAGLAAALGFGRSAGAGGGLALRLGGGGTALAGVAMLAGHL